MEQSQIAEQGLAVARNNQIAFLAYNLLPSFFAKQDRQYILAELKKIMGIAPTTVRHGFLEYVQLLLKAEYPEYRRTVVVVQFPPHRRHLWFTNSFLRRELGEEAVKAFQDSRSSISLPLPYLYFAVAYAAQKDQVLKASNLHMGFMTKPLHSLDQPVFDPHLPNHMGNLRMCLGDAGLYSFCSHGTLANAQENISRLFRSAFSTHAYDEYKEKLNAVGLRNIFEWSSCAEYPLRSLAKCSEDYQTINGFLFDLLKPKLLKKVTTAEKRDLVLTAAVNGLNGYGYGYYAEILANFEQSYNEMRSRYEKAKGDESRRSAMVKGLVRKLERIYNRR